MSSNHVSFHLAKISTNYCSTSCRYFFAQGSLFFFHLVFFGIHSLLVKALVLCLREIFDGLFGEDLDNLLLLNQKFTTAYVSRSMKESGHNLLYYSTFISAWFHFILNLMTLN